MATNHQHYRQIDGQITVRAIKIFRIATDMQKFCEANSDTALYRVVQKKRGHSTF